MMVKKPNANNLFIRNLLITILREEGFKKNKSLWLRDIGPILQITYIDRGTFTEQFSLSLGWNIKSLPSKTIGRNGLKDGDLPERHASSYQARPLGSHYRAWQDALSERVDMPEQEREEIIRRLYVLHIRPFWNEWTDPEAFFELAKLPKSQRKDQPTFSRTLLAAVRVPIIGVFGDGFDSEWIP